jgi:ferrous iron transport protein A
MKSTAFTSVAFPSTATNTSLDKMTPGQEGTVSSIVPHSPLSRRLFEMGVVPGRHVVCLRSAPLRDPVAFQVGSTCLSLRKSEASLVSVDITD